MKLNILYFSMTLLTGFSLTSNAQQSAKIKPGKVLPSWYTANKSEPQSVPGSQQLTPDQGLIREKIKSNLRSKLVNGRGNEGGHGGDPYALEFVSVAELWNEYLQTNNSKLFATPHLTTKRFASAVKETRVLSVDKNDAILEGAEVNAINLPEDKVILINSDRWRELDINAKVKLVFHEYLGILSIEQDAFNVSINFLNVSQRLAGDISRDPKYANLMVNIYYGQCLGFTPLSSSQVCEHGSDALSRAEVCAKAQAENKCRLSGKVSCQLVDISYEPVANPEMPTARYCKVLVLMK